MDADIRVAAIAARRHGVVTRADALAAGLSLRQIRWRVDHGRWGELQPGVYRIAGSTPTWDQTLCAAWLAAGEGAAVSHAAAAALWNIPHVASAVEISVPARRTPVVRRAAVHRVASLDMPDLTTRAGMTVTTPTRTVLDLSGRLPSRLLELVVDHCLVHGLTTVEHLAERLLALGRRGRHGVARVDAVLADRATDAHAHQSVLERDLEALLADLPGPRPVRQYPLTLASGVTIHVDLAWPTQQVGIEAQGYRFHADRRAWALDQSRWAEAGAVGWRLLPVTWHDVRQRPRWVLETVALALAGGVRGL